tara:strand:+ start:362 stop:496 length:135 start_codon:yes stop_codon:yes gene_type:complete
MHEIGLFAFQIEEMLTAFKYIVCGVALALGVGIWLHATYFRKEE